MPLGPNDGYEYRAGDSESDFVNRNLWNDLTDDPYWALGGFAGASISGGIRGYRGRSAYKRAHRDWVREMRGRADRAREKSYEGFTAGVDRQMGIDDQMRRDALSTLEKGFADPSRARARYDAYDANLGNEIAQISSGYQNSTKRAAQEAVKRGRLGSSTDAEKQSKIGMAARNSVMSAENSAFDQFAALEDQDYRQMQSLRRSLLTGDPQAQQAYRAQAAQTSGQIDRILAQGADAQRRREQAALADMQRYSMYGELMNAGGSAVNGYYGNPQYGGY